MSKSVQMHGYKLIRSYHTGDECYGIYRNSNNVKFASLLHPGDEAYDTPVKLHLESREDSGQSTSTILSALHSGDYNSRGFIIAQETEFLLYKSVEEDVVYRVSHYSISEEETMFSDEMEMIPIVYEVEDETYIIAAQQSLLTYYESAAQDANRRLNHIQELLTRSMHVLSAYILMRDQMIEELQDKSDCERIMMLRALNAKSNEISLAANSLTVVATMLEEAIEQ